MKYRKKPVVIQAAIFEKDPFDFDYFYDFSNNDELGHIPMQFCSEHGSRIETLEGYMKISKGDYIIKGVKGEFYPCRADIFEMTYEPLNQGGEG